MEFRGPKALVNLHGCPVLRRQETTAERHTCELRVLIASIVRAPPKRASGESFSPFTKDLHGRRRSGRWKNERVKPQDSASNSQPDVNPYFLVLSLTGPVHCALSY